MKKVIYLISFFLITIIFSCEKKTKFDFDQIEHKLSVNFILCPDSLCKVYISKSLLPDDVINFKGIKNATVELIQNNKSLGFLNTYTEAEKDPGIGYYSNPNIIINDTGKYEINISHSQYENVYAVTRMPSKPNVEKIELIDYSLVKDEFNKAYTFDAVIQLNINDYDIKENYFSVNLFYYADFYIPKPDIDTLYREKISFEINSPSAIRTYKLNTGYIISDELFNGEKINLTININNVINVDNREFSEFYIQIKSISKDYYLYQKTLKEYYMSNNNPFSEQIEVFGNIDNGYGIFAGYNSIVDTLRDCYEIN